MADPSNPFSNGIDPTKDPMGFTYSSFIDPGGLFMGEGVGGVGRQAWEKFAGARQPGQVTIGQTGMPGFSGAGGPDLGQTNAARSGQLALIQQLQDQANGNGPSLAQMQFQSATDKNLANAAALGASQRGAGQAGMLKGIQTQQAGISQEAAGQSGMIRLQEQMAARAALGQNLGAMRQGDLGAAGMALQGQQFNAGQANQMALANAQREADRARAQAQLDMDREKLKSEAAAKGSPMGFIGGLLSAFSDENLKTDVKSGEKSLYQFLDKLGVHDYKYKSTKHGEGRRISPMAQELEKSEMGKQFVFETPEGKAVDYGKGFGTMLAAQAALHKRLKKLEGK